MFDLTGKKALITGASGGIGAAIARSFHAQGAVVTLSGTRKDALDALAGELGERAYVVACDLGEPEAAQVLAKEAESAMGGLDILVNNAGLTRDGLMMRMKDEDWQKVIDVNLSAGFRLSRACIKPMMKARWGRIIAVTSVVAATGNAGQANYAASKAGMTGMIKSLGAEIAARGVTANCIAPGFIVTAMTDGLNETVRERLLAAIPAARFGDVGDVAAAAVFLASDESAYVTGQTLHVNGGMAMI
ncbi:MAG: 3-oxoacyl-[acyl-carrier-protein] reductase [Rhodospirillaceae bacterium]|jgi:3-oxoacyl-[acyl-carrier protein] reductase|nr:3-oxoacyl-[acyl-carrier-protein] reductase [Rhodospirillaceae bacterium]MBT5660033.1 3-oxoacyl-[acyl-carrier-protein] reductase [Rhodospirillaceae bacterium]MBT5752703.1 3-oxoacyl-[acyl-carrier-protein] reductase [Rhodospirillaceae bacterium]